MKETDAEFVWRARDCYGSLTGEERDRLFSIARRGVVMQWKPIETAPRDGQWFIAIDVDGRAESLNWPPNYSLGKWDKRPPRKPDSWGEWGGHAVSKVFFRATHWMPIIGAPSLKEDKT